MVTKNLVLTNEEGLHARAAALFVRTANRFQSEITLSLDGEEVNGKSIIGLCRLEHLKVKRSQSRWTVQMKMKR